MAAAVVVAIAIGVAAVGSFGIWSADDSLKRYEDTAHDALLASEISSNMAKLLLNAREYLATRSERDLSDAHGHLAKTREGVALVLEQIRLAGEPHHEADVADLHEMADELDRFGKGLARLVTLMSTRDKIVAEELELLGPRIRQRLTELIESSIRAGEFESSSIAGSIQEDFLSARLFTKKFLLENNDEDAERVEAELHELGVREEELRQRSVRLDLPIAAELLAIHGEVLSYLDAFRRLRPIIAERNRVRSETLDHAGTRISALATQMITDLVGRERQLAASILESNDRDKIAVPLVTLLALAVPGCGLLVLFGKLRQREAEIELRNGELNAALQHMNHGLCMFDAQSRLVFSSRRFAELYDLGDDGVQLGKTFRQIIEDRIARGTIAGDAEAYLSSQLAAATSRTPWELAETFNSGRVVSVVFLPIDSGGWVTTHEDITERSLAAARLDFLAHHDALTGLPNRVQLEERLALAIERARQGGVIAVHLLDLDRFKAINDSLGDAAGDKLLGMVAERLRAAAGPADTVARMGGDEFAVIQEAIRQPSEAAAFAQRMIKSIDEPYLIDGHQCHVGACVGAAISPAHGDRPSDIIRNADLALYRAKADGRGVARFFEPGMDLQVQARRIMELDLRRALAVGEFELHYQPIFNLESNDACGVEALIRWRHPDKGMIAPDAFIPLAEEIGLIVPIGEWVLGRACAAAAKWPGHIKVAVNVSPLQFRHAGLVQAVFEALESSGLQPERLELEITETAVMEQPEVARAMLEALCKLGVHIVLDDFGMGYSSLTHLHSFPFDKIKIDRSFIVGAAKGGGSHRIMRAVVALAGGLDMATTAEGVETEEQLNAVRAEGCTEAQGFYFSRPLPEQEVDRMLRADRAMAVA